MQPRGERCGPEAIRFITDLCVASDARACPDLSSTSLLYLDAPARDQLRVALAQDPGVAQALLTALEHPAPHVADWAYAVALEAGAPCGQALAALLPDQLTAFAEQFPVTIAAFRRREAALLKAIDLVARLVPERIAHLYQLMNEQRGEPGSSPWWTFRIWQHLTEMVQMQIAAGDLRAVELVLEVLVAGADAPQHSAAHWRASWALHLLVPHLLR